MRLIWLLLAIGSGGTFIFIYLIFWALVPEARTTAEKLMMTGDPVNISNIEKKIKDSIDSVSETVKNVDFKKHGEKLKEGLDDLTDNISETVKSVDFQKQGNRLKSSSQTFFDSIGNIVMFFLKIIAKFIGIILIVTGIGALITLIVALFTVGITDAIHLPGIDLLYVANAANTPIWLMSTLAFFAVGIPFFFIFYLGLKILVNNLKSIGNVAKFTLLGVWLITIIGIVILMIKQFTEHTFDAKVVTKNELTIKASDTLNLSNSEFDEYSSYRYHHNNEFNIIENDEGRSLVSNNVRYIVKSTTDSVASITIEKEATGSDYNRAKKRAENIDYGYRLDGNRLVLDKYLKTDIENKFSEQEVRVIIYLPEGTIIQVDKSFSRSWRYSYSIYGNNLLRDMEFDKYYRIEKNHAECLDCIKDEDIEDAVTSEEISSSKQEKSIISQKIDEDGVDLEVNNN
tara:strand:- start:3217 stop:4587 length:1371 start_codon:yes stop_codon:yes gene_type:complete